MQGTDRVAEAAGTTVPDSHAEAERLMRICNACRYCEGLCAMFQGMALRRTFGAGDLNHLANLCHNCGACYHDCQYAPPHEFAVNVPVAMAELRPVAWQQYAWPGFLAPLFRRNGTRIAVLAALSVAVFLFGLMAVRDPAVMFGSHTGPGAFYRILPHGTMAVLFGGAFLFALLAMAMSLRNAWRSDGISVPVSGGDGGLTGGWRTALRDAATLRNLDGGGAGCMNDSDRPDDRRKHYHHATLLGFGLCLASTSVATLSHYLLGWQAPYSWYSLPVVLGTLGGVGLVVGPVGLLRARARRAAEVRSPETAGMDRAFIWMLLAVALTGLALLVLRGTPAMGSLLAVHMGFVFVFFLTMPYGRFMHGLHRFAALLRHAMERQSRGG